MIRFTTEDSGFSTLVRGSNGKSAYVAYKRTTNVVPTMRGDQRHQGWTGTIQSQDITATRCGHFHQKSKAARQCAVQVAKREMRA